MAEQVLDTLILSDVHLGSEVSRAREATELIAERISADWSFSAISSAI